MKTNKFIKQAKELGYEVKEDTCFGFNCLNILNNNEYKIATVNLQIRYDFGTYKDFHFETAENQGALFDLITKYAKTPVEKR